MSDAPIQSPEEYDNSLGDLLTKAADSLGEHFECVLIIASNSLPEDVYSNFVRTRGQQNAAIGMAVNFLERQKERMRQQIIRELRDNDE